MMVESIAPVIETTGGKRMPETTPPMSPPASKKQKVSCTATANQVAATNDESKSFSASPKRKLTIWTSSNGSVPSTGDTIMSAPVDQKIVQHPPPTALPTLSAAFAPAVVVSAAAAAGASAGKNVLPHHASNYYNPLHPLGHYRTGSHPVKLDHSSSATAAMPRYTSVNSGMPPQRSSRSPPHSAHPLSSSSSSISNNTAASASFFQTLTKSQFMTVFEHLYDANNLVGTLKDQVRKSANVLHTISATGTMIEGLVRTHVKEMQAEFTDSIMAAIDDLNTRLKRVEEVMSKPSNNNINGEGMDEANKSSSTRGQGSSSSSTTSSSSSSSVDMLREAVARVEHLVEESDKNTNNQ